MWCATSAVRPELPRSPSHPFLGVELGDTKHRVSQDTPLPQVLPSDFAAARRSWSTLKGAGKGREGLQTLAKTADEKSVASI